MVIILIGVSGAGKTTVGQLLAQQLHWEFADADNYHSAINIEKMKNGIPLTDADRAPWLKTLRNLLTTWIDTRKNAVLACSALKHVYREELRIASEIQFVYLKAPTQLLHQRLHARQGHYMTERMLDSQLQALEEPEKALTINVDRAPVEIVREIRARLMRNEKA